jgi:hypothetical protein
VAGELAEENNPAVQDRQQVGILPTCAAIGRKGGAGMRYLFADWMGTGLMPLTVSGQQVVRCRSHLLSERKQFLLIKVWRYRVERREGTKALKVKNRLAKVQGTYSVPADQANHVPALMRTCEEGGIVIFIIA